MMAALIFIAGPASHRQKEEVMKKMWKKLAIVLCAVLIMGTSVISVSAADTSVNGGASSRAATTISLNRKYVTTLRSTQGNSVFKFKTNSYTSYYELRAYNVSVSRPINVYLRTAGGAAAGTASNNMNVRRGDDAYIHTANTQLKANTWYYVILRNGNNASGKVRFEVKGVKDLEGNTKSAAKKVSADTTYYGYHTFPLDQDYFKFVPTRTGNYRVHVKNVGSAGYVRSSVQTAGGTMLKKKEYFPVNSYMSEIVRLTRGTTYYVHVQTGNEEWSDRNTKYRVYIQQR